MRRLSDPKMGYQKPVRVHSSSNIALEGLLTLGGLRL